MKRGLTLIEVLLSLALLTLIATTTLPLMRAALSALHDDHEPAGRPSHADLAELADAFMEDPSAFDIRIADLATGLDAFSVGFREHAEWGAIEVRVQRSHDMKEDDSDRSVWIVFTEPSERWTVSRWLSLPKGAVP